MSSQFVQFHRNSETGVGSTNFKTYINGLLKQTKLLSREEEYKLLLKAKEGDASAKDELLLANVLFFYKVSRHYFAKFPALGLEDLFSEMYIAADKALGTFKTMYKIRFISWAIGYMKNAVMDYARKNLKSVKVPTGTFKKANRFYNLADVVGEDAAKFQLNLSEFEASELELNYSKDSKISNTDARNEDEPISVMPDHYQSADREVLANEKKTIVLKALTSLDPREQEILKKVYGIDCLPTTMAAIGREMGITKKKVSLIVSSALRRLKNSAAIEYKSEGVRKQ